MHLSDIFWCLLHKIKNFEFLVGNNKQSTMFSNRSTWTLNAQLNERMFIGNQAKKLAFSHWSLESASQFSLVGEGGGEEVGSRSRFIDRQLLMNGKTPISRVRNFQCSDLIKSQFDNRPISYVCIAMYNCIPIIYIMIKQI